ncbi:uncharacterized protein FFNC_15374 [Fusarium fujikuroi]|nr:uncharacterized protein FFNC_15374 [Fusarium fujikuroi]
MPIRGDSMARAPYSPVATEL